MIIGNLDNKTSYSNLSGNLKKGFEFLLNTDLKALQTGKLSITEDLWANVEEYYTKKTGKPEAHRKFIDIQTIINGAEVIEYTDINNCRNSQGYDEGRDIEFFGEVKYEKQKILLQENDFAIFFPQDAHTPQLINEKSEKVKKIVVKVSV